MSLINEALKKAQSDRQSSGHRHPAFQGMPMDSHQPPPKKKRYLFGFVLAVLVVALLSTLASTFLLYQILGDEESGMGNSDAPTEVAAASKEAVAPQQLEGESVSGEPEASQLAAVAEPDAEAVAMAPVETTSPEEPVKMEPEPAVTVQAPAAENPVPALVAPAVVADPAPKFATGENNPMVWQRLEDLEIRGIMSGGTKVLIFDSRSQKARAYKPGDLVDGALSLRLSSIAENQINFENNDGFIFPKSF